VKVAYPGSVRQPIPIACSLTASEQADRSEEFATVLQRGLLGREEIPGGVRLHFRRSTGLREDLVELTEREKECCPFFDFRIDASDEEVVLEVIAPEEARPIVDLLLEGSPR
jgi:MerR family transcriptional regulator, copper efflux regulator